MSAGKSLGRRLFARAVVGVPTALKFGAGPPHPPPSPGYGYPFAGATAGQVTAAEALREKVWKGLRLKMRPEEERRDARYVRRHMMGGLDPDLSVLNSVSLQHRIIRQIEREKAEQERHRGLRGTIIKALGGNPEDFE